MAIMALRQRIPGCWLYCSA